MPELPEVETVMRGLAARLEGRVIRRAELRRPDLRFPIPDGLAARLTGARVLGFRRRGKYMLMRLEGGASVLIHLGMSGRVQLSDTLPNAETPHEHLVLETDEGWRIGLVDPRRFGAIDLVATAEEDGHRLLAGMGPEPLDAGFTPAVLSAALAGQEDADQGRAARPGRRGRARQHLCVRGAVPRRHLAAALRPHRGRRPGRTARARHQGDARGGDRRRRVIAARLRAAQRANSAISSTPGRSMAARASHASAAPAPPACAGIGRIVQSGRSTFLCAANPAITAPTKRGSSIP